MSAHNFEIKKVSLAYGNVLLTPETSVSMRALNLILDQMSKLLR